MKDTQTEDYQEQPERDYYSKQLEKDMIILDIETRPDNKLVDLYLGEIKPPSNWKDEKKIEEYIEKKKSEVVKKMSVDTDYCEVAMVGVKRLGEKAKVLTLEEFARFSFDIEKIITFNGKGFDIPVLIKAGLKNKLDLPYKRLKAMCKKWYSDAGHYDLMEIIGDGNYRSLNEYLKIYCGIEKTEIDFETATEEELKAHCLEDLENIEKLFNIFKPLI